MARTIFQGNGDIVFIPDTTTPANLAALTAPDLAAGTSLLGVKGEEAIFDHFGFEPNDTTIPVPDWIDNVIGSIEGTTSYDTGGYRLYHDPDNTAIFDLLTKGTLGLLVRAPSGTASTNLYDVFPVVVQRRKLDINVDNTAQAWTVVFALSAPSEGAFA